MLEILFDESELFNSKTNEIYVFSKKTIRFEHSLIAISKWEEKYRKSFVESTKSIDEVVYYAWCMCLDDIEYEEFTMRLNQQILNKISDYISDTPTATKVPLIGDKNHKGDKITSELIYYWLTIHNIPFSVESWNFHRMMALIEIAIFKSTPPKKRSNAEILRERRELNERRLKEMKSHG